MDNFEFLKSINKNLYNIIVDAENLYRDEYFEQCITQTRRFGEVVCQDVLGSARTTERTFDDMLATLKDKVTNVVQEKEFIDDLYFLKREGNSSVHSLKVKKDGIVALECLQRAFEIALNYVVYYKKSNPKLLKLHYDTELLITGKKVKETLVQRYQKEKSKNSDKSVKKKTSSKKSNKIYKTKINSKMDKKISFYWIFVGLASIISMVLVLTIFLLSFVS